MEWERLGLCRMTSQQLSVFSGISQADYLLELESLQGVSSGDALMMYSQVGMIEDDNADILQENDYNVSANDYISYQGEYVLYQDVESSTSHSMFCLFIGFSFIVSICIIFTLLKVGIKAFKDILKIS